MTWGFRLTAAAGISFLVTILGALSTLRVKKLAFLRDRTDGRPIGGPALGLGIGCGLVTGMYAAVINPLVAGGAGLIFLLGLLDDAVDLSPWRKLIGQSIAAALATAGMGGMVAISIAGAHAAVGIGGLVLTFFWIVALTNAVNLIDGVDGLAIGVTLPAALGLVSAAAFMGNRSGGILGMIIIGGVVGFYPWNWARARLLLGDTGAELIGYLLAVASLQVFTAGERAFPILPALFFFSFPIADTVFAVVRRIYHHRAVFHGDRAHIHHRLERVIGCKNTVLLLSLLSILTTGIGVILWLRAA